MGNCQTTKLERKFEDWGFDLDDWVAYRFDTAIPLGTNNNTRPSAAVCACAQQCVHTFPAIPATLRA